MMDTTKGDHPVLMPEKSDARREHNARADKLAARVYPVCDSCWMIITGDLIEHKKDCRREYARHP